MDFIFCKISKKKIYSKILYEDDEVMVIMDTNPNVDGHALIIPKKHYTDYLELDSQISSHIMDVAQNIGPKIMKAVRAQSLTMLINYGFAQKVKHLHVHLLPDFGTRSNHAKEKIEDVFEIIKKEL